jgi:hypothetical protein
VREGVAQHIYENYCGEDFSPDLDISTLVVQQFRQQLDSERRTIIANATSGSQHNDAIIPSATIRSDQRSTDREVNVCKKPQGNSKYKRNCTAGRR